MATLGKIYKTRVLSENYIEPLGDLTLNGNDQVLKTINLLTFGQIRSATIVVNAMTLAGATTLIWYGSTATSGGTLTAIATLTLTSAHTEAALTIEAEDISAAAEVAGLMPEGFLSIQAVINGTNNDVAQSCVVVEPLHMTHMLTPSDVVALT
jgi:hypothetical protein